MSLPIPPISRTVTVAIAAARAAASAVQQVASVVADSTGSSASSSSPTFGEVFQSASATADADAGVDVLKGQFAESARKALAALGIEPGEKVSLNIAPTGRIELAGDNPQHLKDKAAHIEATLAANSNLSNLARQVSLASGAQQINLELSPSDNLTIPPSQANMVTRFGG